MTEKEMLQLLLDKMNNFENKMNNLEKGQLSLQEGQKEILREQRIIKEQVVKNSEDITQINNKLAELTKGQEVIKVQVVKNSEDISQLATKKDVDKRLDYQLARISKVEEEVEYLKAQTS